MVKTDPGASATYSKYHELILMPPNLEEESEGEDLPEYLSNSSLDQESEVIWNPTTPSSFSPSGTSGSPSLSRSLSENNCIICYRPNPLKDVATCGDRTCDQELETWQGLGSSHPSAGPPSINRCPLCNDFKLSDDIICGKEICLERLRFRESPPSINQSVSSNHPRSSFTSNGRSGSSSNSGGTQTRSQTRTGGHMCSVCHQRPRYSHNGKSYPVCGLTCAAKLNSSGRVEMCDFCHKRPKIVRNGRMYPHCGRTCRDKARGAKVNNGFSRRSCTTCLNCWKAPANVQKDEFCSDSCRDTIEYRAPLLLEVPRGHASFNVVEKEFKGAWTQHGAPCPSVKKIYMVCISAKHEANFEDYGKKVSSTGRRKEEFRWISGQRDCPLGQPGMMTPCGLPQCQLCTILRGTYVPEIFDQGILTMSLPRATYNYDRWASNNPTFKFSKIVLLSKIYPGKVVELDSLQARSGPPKGANSVRVRLGDYVHHSRGAMDEILVYSSEALRPVYLISYE